MAELASQRRFASIRTAELIDRARIGRSTFYEHFKSKDDVLIALLEPILVQLANIASARAPRAAVTITLRHVWEQRHLMRTILDGAIAVRLQRRLASMIEDRRQRDNGIAMPLQAAAIASGQLTMLRLWLSGAAALGIEEFARQLLLFRPPPSEPSCGS